VSYLIVQNADSRFRRHLALATGPGRVYGQPNPAVRALCGQWPGKGTAIGTPGAEWARSWDATQPQPDPFNQWICPDCEASLTAEREGYDWLLPPSDRLGHLRERVQRLATEVAALRAQYVPPESTEDAG
jgi:hypothetical protein